MLTVTRRGAVIEVKQTLMGATTTKTSYWYFDTEKWLRSNNAKQGEVPSTPMDAAQIEWCKRHYIPKAVDAPKEGASA